MAPEEGWNELHILNRRECPKLFYTCSIADSVFTFLVTDLTGLWRCSLDKDQIHSEAIRQHCPIDPSASLQQFSILLLKLKLSIGDGDNLLAHDNSRRSQSSLLLLTTIPLPKPLRPLEWTFQLVPQTTSEMAEQILRPCLREIAVSQHKLQSLNHVIKEKDHVISKLLDRIGNSAIDLSLIFPGITGLAPKKGHITVSDAMKHVPGMAPFDPKAWANQLVADNVDENFANERGLRNLATGCEICFVHSKSEHEDWISTLPGPGSLVSHTKSARKEKITRKESTPQPPSEDESTASENDFERQATPPSSKKDKDPNKNSSPTFAPQLQDNASPTPPAKRTKLGKIGGLRRNRVNKEQSAPPVSSSDKPERSTSAREHRKSDTSLSTGSEAEAELVSADKAHSSPKATKLYKLGKLGKRSKASASSASRQSESPPSLLSRSLKPSTIYHSLGPLGSRHSGREADSPDGPVEKLNSKTSTPKRLGRIGISKRPAEKSDHQSSSEYMTSATPAAQTRAKTEKDHSTASGDDSDATASTSPGSPTASRRKQDDELSPPATLPETQSTAPPRSPTPNRNSRDKEPEDETADQRANRRREELKRALNTGGGAKKRRRF